MLRNVAYRQNRPVIQNVVIRWKKGLPARRDECWFLMTDLKSTAVRLSQMYGQRMTVEELFRDGKNKRNGWSLRDTRITRADRLDRLMLTLALAYLLLCGIGRLAQKRFKASAWCSNSKSGTCSLFLIGQLMQRKLKCSAAQAFQAFLKATEEEAPNWG